MGSIRRNKACIKIVRQGVKRAQEKSHGKLSRWRRMDSVGTIGFESQETPGEFEDAPVRHGN